MKRAILVLAVLTLLTAAAGALDVADHPWLKSVVFIGNIDVGGIGTGFVVAEDGYIVTAAHVVQPIGTTVVAFADPLLYRQARIVYHDLLRDIAVLKVEVTEWPVASDYKTHSAAAAERTGVEVGQSQVSKSMLKAFKIGDLRQLKIGDWVWTMGHPEGISWLLARGILSGIKYDRDGYAYIFSDVASRPGSSGSPILNEQGEVIGMVQEGDGSCIGIASYRLKMLIGSVIESDRQLVGVRAELAESSEQARAQWKRLIERINDQQE